MAIQMPVAVMRFVPDTHGVMAQDDPLLTMLDGMEMVDTREARLNLECFLFVVADDEVNVAVEPRDVVIGRLHGEVAEMVNSVVRSDDRIPVANQILVHRVDGTVRTIAVFDDVSVPEMGVASEENWHRNGASYGTRTHAHGFRDRCSTN